MHFEFATATRIVFGPGALAELGVIAKGLGRRALLVTGRRPDRATRAKTLLADSGVTSVGFAVPGEPEVQTIVSGTELAQHSNCDLVVSFGGGSALDAGKAIAAMLTNPGELLDYLEVIGRGKSLTQRSAPFIAVPTTAGTGSEVTRNAVLASPERRVKVSLRSPLMLPCVALVDPSLTLELPPPLTASSGLDALTQLLEPFVCSRSNPVTDSLCREGLRRVARSLRLAFADGQNAAAREDMALASLFGGLALANAGLGAVHGFAGPLGGMFPAPHGALCAALLPHVVEANIVALQQRSAASEALSRYEEAVRTLTGEPNAKLPFLPQWLRQLVCDLGVPGLASYGLTSAHLPELLEKSGRASSMKANPITLTNAEMTAILLAAL